MCFQENLKSSGGYPSHGLCASECIIYIQEMIAFCVGEYEVQHWILALHGAVSSARTGGVGEAGQ